MKNNNLTHLIEKLGQPLVCLDIETTGGHLERDRITEIGMVTLLSDGSSERWSTLINPDRWIPNAITRLTGIDDAMVADAPSFSDQAPKLFERLKGCIVVAHNARFDMGFLKQAFRREGLSFQPRMLCSVKLSRHLFPGQRSHGLDAVMTRLGLVCTARHRALGDAQVVADFVMRMAEERMNELIAACHEQWQLPSLPPHLPADMLDNIPDRPGVYLIFGENDLPLYIGKSIHLRKRILDHFRSDHRQQKEMRLAQQAQRVDWIETPGELSALLLESRLIKERSPTLNRKLRRSRALCSLRWTLGTNSPPQFVHGDDIVPGECYGTFRNAKEAEKALHDMAIKHGLCDIRLGLQKGSGACFAHQLKRCNGACMGLESPMQHDLRLAQALLAIRIARWPYSSPIGIRESGFNQDVLHVIDQWVYLGQAKSEDEAFELIAQPRPAFDLDTYRILLRHLQDENILTLQRAR